ncbi:hypothetical protein CC80DRAFT_29756 [Byssothecium circinans]|uniref:Uncharacterized protein n=1 Tax=Byssothecium circinans TaxID=147558 RepID=A0A6A5U254_9PLEO|nr:hypothetical protein CC80DRAFT_29756 [Byssothecium circinans]
MSNSRPTSALEQQRYMLDDLTQNCQRMSASLPPDDWDLELPPLRLERKPSGILVPSAPATPTIELTRPHSSADANTSRPRNAGEEERGLLTYSSQGKQSGDADERVVLNSSGGRGQSQSSGEKWWRRICCYPCRRRDGDASNQATASSKSTAERIKDTIKHISPLGKNSNGEHNAWWRRKERQVSGDEPLL